MVLIYDDCHVHEIIAAYSCIRTVVVVYILDIYVIRLSPKFSFCVSIILRGDNRGPGYSSSLSMYMSSSVP